MIDINDYMPGGFRLRAGAGGGDPRDGLCYLETVALIAGEAISDHPECACPIVTAYGIGLNDDLGDDARQRLLPLVWATAGTRSKEHERQRLEILGRAAIDCALMVLPIYESMFPSDTRPRDAIGAAVVYWNNPTAAAAAAAAYAAADAARAAASASAHAAADARAAANALDCRLKARILGRSIQALRDAIEAGPNGGVPESAFVPRIDAVRDALTVT